jgi:hypothetical protein
MSERTCPQEAYWPVGAIFTLGHSTLPIDHFIPVLKAYSIERLVDIRTMPRSRHNPQFNGTCKRWAVCGKPAKALPIPAGATQAFAVTPITCK